MFRFFSIPSSFSFLFFPSLLFFYCVWNRFEITTNLALDDATDDDDEHKQQP